MACQHTDYFKSRSNKYQMFMAQRARDHKDRMKGLKILANVVVAIVVLVVLYLVVTYGIQR